MSLVIAVAGPGPGRVVRADLGTAAYQALVDALSQYVENEGDVVAPESEDASLSSDERREAAARRARLTAGEELLDALNAEECALADAVLP